MVVLVGDGDSSGWKIGSTTSTLRSLRAGVRGRNGNGEDGDSFGTLLLGSDDFDELGWVDITEFLLVVNFASLAVLSRAGELNAEGSSIGALAQYIVD